MRISSIGLIAAVSLGLGGCAYNGLGMGVGNGYGYDNYGNGYDRYADANYNPYGYNAYGSPGAWYNGYYYPGSGGWVYDRDGRRREITRDEQAHFGRLTEVFRERVKQARSSATSTSSRTADTTATPVRAPARTRVIEQRQRPSTTGERSTNGATRIFRRVIRDRKDD